MISVTCAIIRNDDGQILVVQRGEATDHPLKWEFPGGKLDRGETEEECIIREIREELSMDIVICRRMDSVEHDYGHKQIMLIPFVCDTLDELPFLSEHNAYKWVSDAELLSCDFSEADVFVAQNYLSDTLTEDNPGSLQKEVMLKPDRDDSVNDAELQAIINHIRSMKAAEWLAAYATENPAFFLKLYKYSFSSDKQLAFKASWCLTKVCDVYPEGFYTYLPEIVETIGSIDNESVLRSLLRIISMSNIDKLGESYHGLLADFCLSRLNSRDSAVAIKIYSMEIVYRLSLLYPELANELAASIRVIMEDGSAGITSRGRKTLKKLAGMPVKPKSTQK
jgi:8-oxo-dGTP diphosphatase